MLAPTSSKPPSGITRSTSRERVALELPVMLVVRCGVDEGVEFEVALCAGRLVIGRELFGLALDCIGRDCIGLDCIGRDAVELEPCEVLGALGRGVIIVGRLVEGLVGCSPGKATLRGVGFRSIFYFQEFIVSLGGVSLKF